MNPAEIFSLVILTITVLLIPVWRRYYFVPNLSIKHQTVGRQRLIFYDFVRGVAISAVIIIHVGYFFVYYQHAQANSLFVILANNLSRFCIPLFFIVSGILLKPWKEVKNKGNFYKKKLFRIFLPYLLVVTWLAIYYQASVGGYFYNLVSGRALPPFYFIIILAQLYLIYPYLSFYRHSKYFLLTTFIISWIAVVFFDPWLFYGTLVGAKFIFFLAYGMYWRDYFLANSRPAKTSLVLWFTIIAVYIINSIYLPASYYNIRFFYGLAIFNLLYYYRDTLASWWIYKIFIGLGKYSLWIFLVHFPIEFFIYKLSNTWPIDWHGQFILIALFTLLFSYCLSLILAWGYAWLLKIFSINMYEKKQTI